MSLIGVSEVAFNSYSFASSVKMVLEELGFYPLYVSVYAEFVEDGNTV